MKQLLALLPLIFLLNARAQEDCTLSEWDGEEKIIEFVKKMNNKRRPQGNLTENEKNFWKLKDDFKLKSKELLVKVRDLECSSRKDPNSKTKLPSDDPQVMKKFQELKKLHEKIKSLMPELQFTDADKKRIYEDQSVLIGIDWDFFEDNYKWLNSVAHSNNFWKINPDFSRAFDVWTKTDNQVMFEKLSKTFKNTYNTKLTDIPPVGILYGLMQAYSGDPIYENGPKLSKDQDDKELLRRIGRDGIKLGDQNINDLLPQNVDWLEVSDDELPMYFRAGLISSFSSDDTKANVTIFNSKKVPVPERLKKHHEYKDKTLITLAEALYADKGIKNWDILKRNGFFQDLIEEYEYIDHCTSKD